LRLKPADTKRRSTSNAKPVPTKTIEIELKAKIDIPTQRWHHRIALRPALLALVILVASGAALALPPSHAAAAKCFGVNATSTGSPKVDDDIDGTNGDDVIVTWGGNDSVRGHGGNDLICLGSGNDKATGGAGSDRILGGAGDDELVGDYKNSTVKGTGRT